MIFLTIFVIFTSITIYALFALMLIFMFGAILCLIFLNAEFLAFAFIIIYVGAISVLFLFAIMLLDIRAEFSIVSQPQESDNVVKRGDASFFLLAILCIIFLVIMIYFVTNLSFSQKNDYISLYYYITKNARFLEYMQQNRPKTVYKLLIYVHEMRHNMSYISTGLFKSYGLELIISAFVLFFSLVSAIFLCVNSARPHITDDKLVYDMVKKNSEMTKYKFKKN